MKADIKKVEEKLRADSKKVEEKIDRVRERVSCREEQLIPAKVITFEEARPQGVSRSSPGKVTQNQSTSFCQICIVRLFNYITIKPNLAQVSSLVPKDIQKSRIQLTHPLLG